MKKFLAILTALCLMVGASYAGCGKKVTNSGQPEVLRTLRRSRSSWLDAEGKKATLTITPKDTKGADKLKSLVGKKVKVISEHKKVDSVAIVKG